MWLPVEIYERASWKLQVAGKIEKNRGKPFVNQKDTRGRMAFALITLSAVAIKRIRIRFCGHKPGRQSKASRTGWVTFGKMKRNADHLAPFQNPKDTLRKSS